jgi:hypothetical protein
MNHRLTLPDRRDRPTIEVDHDHARRTFSNDLVLITDSVLVCNLNQLLSQYCGEFVLHASGLATSL